MQTAELDFYAPGVDHRQVRRDRLNQQREMMFSWRKDGAVADPQGTQRDSHVSATRRHRGSYTSPSAQASTRGCQMAPQQVILADSERARAMQKAEKEKRERCGGLWDSAVGQPHDRRREWRATGLEFTKAHFRTSTDPASAYHPRNKAQRRLLTLAEARQEIQADPYEPYWHDRILLSEPTEGRHVTAIAVTVNREEAQQAEAEAAALQAQSRSQTEPNRAAFDATQTLGSDGSAGEQQVDSWLTALGGSIANRQRGAQTAEAMYSELMAQQATLTGTAYGSPESHNVHVPTGELAYTVRPAFVDTHARRTYRGGRRWTLSQTSTTGGVGDLEGRGNGSASTHGPAEGDLHDVTLDSHMADSQTAPRTGASRSAKVGGGVAEDAGEGPIVHTSAEAKSMRVYAVNLHRQVSNKDTSMVTRNEPVRRGVPVLLPQSWVSPGNVQGN